jgi:signal transduction histidine kinase
MTFRRPRFGLVAKFSFLISLPVLIASLALSYNFVRYAENQIRMALIERGKGVAKALSCSSEYGLLVEDREILNGIIRNVLEKDVLYVLIRNTSGEILASYGEVTENIPADTITDGLPVDEPELDLNYRMTETDLVHNVICDVVTVRERRSREDIGILQSGTLSRPREVKKIGTVQVGLSNADMTDYLRKAKLGAIGLTTVVIIVAILTTVALVRVRVKPIKRLAIAAGEVSRGNFDHPVEVKSEDEIGDLAGSFNKMTADLKRSSEALQHRLEMERIITTISTNFISLGPDEIDSGINHALQTIGEFAGVDRSYVFLFSDDGKEVAKAIEWRTGETEPIIDGLKGLSIEAFPWAMQQLSPSGIIHIPRVADLPPEASRERELLQSYGTQSFVGVPMVYVGFPAGLLGFDSVRMGKTWTEEDITLLRMVGEIFVNTLERKRAEEELQHRLEVGERIAKELAEKTAELSRSNEELDAFVYTVSHDLKAPVVSLQGFSSLLMKEYEDRLDENGKMYIERIQKNSERMGILIENLLELSRIGRAKGQEELVNISDVISDVVNELVSQLEERGTRLIVEDQMPTIRCDCTRISQIFANLMSNANKFMGEDNEDPTIEVGYDDRDGYYRFYVKDNGVGIDEEYHAKIFQIFQRLNDVETEGTGVGLAIVKKIVESLGGKIWVDSAKGKGTTIYFTVPKEPILTKR